ncbi:protein LEAD-SENSITIVE 1-like isoform X1 [Diospyros lotus]|uniref:protein LEAD-SENSITIVE 1-like isoform X1 n=1 Tax=Diospyros lotus TaxID=55363 RepID=UPI0022572809|nr:protein LEAD-SENSITIVE 1-like isoform X1 [Diospyros lotus]
MGLISNRVDKKSLKPGDHIYSWRTAYIYAHHGIYVGDDKVIHFTRRGQEVGTGTVLDLLVSSSVPARAQVPCSTCTPPEEGHHGVVSSCVNCFLAGGVLYRYEYAVSRALFLASVRGGTCTLAASDPDDIVVHRANHLLNNGFRRYDTFKNNCEDFAIYCKTGLLVLDERAMGQSGQADSLVSGLNALVSSVRLKLFTTTDVNTMGATAFKVYCESRIAADIGMRSDVARVSVEDLTTRLENNSITRMRRNARVCHSCRRRGHYFAVCPTKRPCPSCKQGIVKCFKVNKRSINKGRLFNICSIKCGFWKWVEEGESSGSASAKSTTNFSVKELSCMFQTQAQIYEKDDVEIPVNVTVHKGKRSVNDHSKGKGLA